MSGQSVTVINVVPKSRSKYALEQVVVSDDNEDTVCCKICAKSFVSLLALRNHSLMKHFNAFSTDDPTSWMEPTLIKAAIPDGSSSEEIDAEALSDSSQELNAKHNHNGLVEASIEIHDGNNKWSHVVDAADANASNWCEQNLAAPQHQGQIHHRRHSCKISGGEYARLSDVNLKHYNGPSGYAHKFGATVQKKRKLSTDTGNEVNQTSPATEKGKTNYEDIEKTFPQNTNKITVFTKTNNSNKDNTNMNNEQILKGKKVCNFCNKSFTCQFHLTTHIRTHTGEKPYQCNVCNKYFTCQSRLTVHIRTHTGEKPYKCNVCNKSFSVKSYLPAHIRTHTGEKPYKCNVCNKSFSDKRSLCGHIRTHTGKKPYQCNVCNKDFARNIYLILHLRAHTGEKPYQCNVCNKSFSDKSYLSTHIRTHTGEKPYQCNVCNKSFSDKSYLPAHIRTHTGEKPYQCNVCNKSFSDKSYLRVHIRTHTGEKPYQCNVCNKDFARNTHLILHLRTHTGEKPYQCNVCNKSFSGNRSLRKHNIRFHTGEKPYHRT